MGRFGCMMAALGYMWMHDGYMGVYVDVQWLYGCICQCMMIKWGNRWMYGGHIWMYNGYMDMNDGNMGYMCIYDCIFVCMVCIFG